MGDIYHQRFHLIVNEKLLNEVAKHVGKEPKNVTEKDINDTIYELIVKE